MQAYWCCRLVAVWFSILVQWIVKLLNNWGNWKSQNDFEFMVAFKTFKIHSWISFKNYLKNVHKIMQNSIHIVIKNSNFHFHFTHKAIIHRIKWKITQFKISFYTEKLSKSSSYINTINKSSHKLYKYFRLIASITLHQLFFFFFSHNTKFYRHYAVNISYIHTKKALNSYFFISLHKI